MQFIEEPVPVKCDESWNLGRWECGVVVSTYMTRKVNSRLSTLDMNAYEFFKMEILKVTIPRQSRGLSNCESQRELL